MFPEQWRCAPQDFVLGEGEIAVLVTDQFTNPVPGIDVDWAVTSGGPELATIGTGDVLGGLIAALGARGLGDDEAARSGA